MRIEKSPLRTLGLLGVGVLCLCGATGGGYARQGQNSTVLDTPLGKAQISGYQKIQANRTSVRVVGPATTLTLTDKSHHDQHRLRAENIQIRKENGTLSVELSGNVHYTLQQSAHGKTLFEGTAQSASYRQPGAKEEATVSLHQARVRLSQDGNPIAELSANELVASQQGQTVTGTGAVQVTALLQTRHATVRADKVSWKRQTNTIVASGSVQVTYVDPDGKESSTRAHRMTLDLTSQALEIE